MPSIPTTQDKKIAQPGQTSATGIHKIKIALISLDPRKMKAKRTYKLSVEEASLSCFLKDREYALIAETSEFSRKLIGLNNPKKL